MIRKICNMCGKELDEYDEQGSFGFHKQIGYGSVFDGKDINLDLCCQCFDKMMKEYIIPNCKVNTIKSYDDEIDYASYEAELSNALS